MQQDGKKKKGRHTERREWAPVHRQDGGAQGLPRVLRARWMPTIKTWMDMAVMFVLGCRRVKHEACGESPKF